MQGIRFYLDHDSPQHKRCGEHNGNCVAVMFENGFWINREDRLERCFGAIGAVYFECDSPCASTNVSLTWLRTCGKRISEAKARVIHPFLFEYLSMGDINDQTHQS